MLSKALVTPQDRAARACIRVCRSGLIHFSRLWERPHGPGAPQGAVAGQSVSARALRALRARHARALAGGGLAGRARDARSAACCSALRARWGLPSRIGAFLGDPDAPSQGRPRSRGGRPSGRYVCARLGREKHFFGARFRTRPSRGAALRISPNEPRLDARPDFQANRRTARGLPAAFLTNTFCENDFDLWKGLGGSLSPTSLPLG